MYSSYTPDPEQFFPLSPLGYVLYGLLFLIPVVGQIAAIILAFKAKNVNLRAFSRAVLIWIAIAVVTIAVFAIVLYANRRLSLFLHNLPKAFRLLFP